MRPAHGLAPEGIDERSVRMSLPAGQQRILNAIEEALRVHDSRLASMFATFTRLTRQEEMPEVEQLKQRRGVFARTRLRRSPRAERSAVARGAGAKPDTSGQPGAGRSVEWSIGQPGDMGWWNRRLQWMALIPIAALTVLSAIVVGLLATSTENPCGARTPSYGAASSLNHAKACPVRQVPFGRG